MLRVYADGGVIRVNPSPYGGTWAYCHVDEEGIQIRKHSGVLKPEEGVGGFVTNNVSELYALCNAIWHIPLETPRCTIYSDSNVSLLRVFRGAKLNGVPDWLAELTGKVRVHLRYLDFTYVLLDGHPTIAQLAAGRGKRGSPVSEWNVWCDKACGKHAEAFALGARP